MANKGGKSKNEGYGTALLFFLGNACLKQGQGGGGSSAAESPLAFLKYTGCYLQKAQSKT